jgi:putative molybdopterin biosynthesis protein
VKSKARILGDEAEINRRVLMAGCDPGAAILAHHLRRSGVELVVAYQNSSRALELLKRGLIHIAGTHIRDEETGESNLPKIHKMFGKDSVAVISFALWEEGIAVLQGNPKEIRSVADFTRPEVRIANREPGAGSRILLDSLLEQKGISGNLVNGYDCIVTGHLPSARQLLAGQADCCINISSAARLFGLGFIPLVSKRYDLVVYRKHLKLPQVQAVFDTLSRATCRRDLENIGGYEMKTAGDRLL